MQDTQVLKLLLLNHNIQILAKILTAHLHHFRFVGGCIRDLKLDINKSRENLDIDLATDLLPEQIITILNQHQIKYFTAGLAHGTVTAVINKQSFEITTLRIDKYCDGRHAEVEFTDDWQQDASRRDFTINALYLDFNGNFYDYFGGINDLKQGIVKFIGNAQQRIDEDYLRILRFVRFSLRYSSMEIEPDIQQLIMKNAPKIKSLSGERIYQELTKILQKSPVNSLINSLNYLGIAEHLEFKLSNISELNTPLDIPERLKLFLLIHLTPENIEKFTLRCRISKIQAKFMKDLLTLIGQEQNLNQILFYYGKELTKDYLYYKKIITNIDISSSLKKIEQYQAQILPVTGDEITKLTNYSGKQIGEKIKQLESKWIESGFTLTKQQLLDYL